MLPTHGLLQLPEGADEQREKLQQALTKLESKRQDVVQIEKEKKNAQRYRGIRFVERRNVTRKLNQLQRALASAGEEVKTKTAFPSPLSTPPRQEKRKPTPPPELRPSRPVD